MKKESYFIYLPNSSIISILCYVFVHGDNPCISSRFEVLLPMLNKYLGISDPIKHIRDFCQAVSLAPGGDPFLYLVFPNSL